MTYEEFEWHVLRMAYEEGVQRLRPSMLAYALGLPHGQVSAFLEQAAHNGVLEMDFTEEGSLEYFVPGIDHANPVPRPLWKDELEGSAPEAAAAAPEPEDGMDGSLTGGTASTTAPSGTDGGAPSRRPTASRAQIPSTLRAHIQSRYQSIDGGSNALVLGESSVDDQWGTSPDDGAMILRNGGDDLAPMRVESSDEAFCDPSRTMFMRQIRVYGSQSQQTIRDQVARLFQSFGYRVVDSTPDRMRFERGSVMFILALVPLFVLVVPLFVYLFLYTMGRSTIQQEPIELDVYFRRNEGSQPFWEIDLTFVGMHGVVLGAADQQVLNREIDTLREELRWALTGS